VRPLFGTGPPVIRALSFPPGVAGSLLSESGFRSQRGRRWTLSGHWYVVANGRSPGPQATAPVEHCSRRSSRSHGADHVSEIWPTFAEPWFLTFNANVEFRVVMTPDDLKKAGLDEIGKKWA
jgi:hypothetical protein